MAKKPQRKQRNVTPRAKAHSGTGETVTGYFRRIFQANPKLLRSRTNEQVVRQWLADHPGEKVMPQKAKYTMANVKSIIRGKRRRRIAARPPAEQMEGVTHARRRNVATGLARLEETIDECLFQARDLDRDGLKKIIDHLRRARNEVVWKLGQ